MQFGRRREPWQGSARRSSSWVSRVASIPLGRCSAGQQRRASLAVLVARGARLWLLDEPHAGLDQEGRDLLDGLLAGSRAAGRTVLFASHEHERAEAIADRVVHLAGGRVVEPAEPVAAPLQVAQQIGQRPGTEAPAHVA